MRSLHLLSAVLLTLGFALSGCDSEGLDAARDCSSSSHPTCDGGGDQGGGGDSGGGDHGDGGGDDGGSGDGGGDDGGSGDGGGDDGGSGDGGGDDGGSGDGGGDTQGLFVAVDATSTYLRTEGGDAFDAKAYLLSDLGIAGGDVACFMAQGDVDLGGGVFASQTGVPLVLAVFSENDMLLGETEPERVKRALDAGEDVQTLGTNPNGFDTDIDQDFDATEACVTVPADAAYVFFSPFDAYYLDNAGVDDYGVTVLKKD